MTITRERLLEALAYDPESGHFTWLVSPPKQRRIGQRAGCKNGRGYVLVQIDDVIYQAHRLAWLYVTGAWPVAEIDHINGITSDNRWTNLRDVSRAINAQNIHRPMPKNSNGLIGVSKHKKRFSAFIKIDRRSRYLGTFSTPQEAHEAYLTAKRELHPGNTL